MSQLKTQMIQAKQFIQAKEYDKARNILKNIEHPKAKEWLTQINQRYPQKKAWDWKLPALGVVATIVLVSIIIFTLAGNEGDSQTASVDDLYGVDEGIEWCDRFGFELEDYGECLTNWVKDNEVYTIPLSELIPEYDAVLNQCQQTIDSDDNIRTCLINGMGVERYAIYYAELARNVAYCEPYFQQRETLRPMGFDITECYQSDDPEAYVEGILNRQS